jgi:multicomponent Na+:H+ antiporter subunit B
MSGALLGEGAMAVINILLLAILFVVSVAIARMRSLFAIVMLSGVYSLVSATWFVALDAVDVAFTEAAVGAGMTTAILLGAMLLTARTAKPEKKSARVAPLLVVVATGIMLIYATVDLPALGDVASPVNQGVGLDYLRVHYFDMGFPNVVTSVLASYRGFDTMGEVGVVFTAGIAVSLLLGFGERSLAESIRKDDKSTLRTSSSDSSDSPATKDGDAS